jgi:hypothetical protein
MTFSDANYFNEVITGIKNFDSELRVFCLKASLDTVKKHLVSRGTQMEGAGYEWISRRIMECVDAHHDSYFGEAVDTEFYSASDIAQEIILRLQQSHSEIL